MADELTNGQDVCAIAVTYHPDAQFPLRVERALREVGALVIVDNGSGDAELEMLRHLARGRWASATNSRAAKTAFQCAPGGFRSSHALGGQRNLPLQHLQPSQYSSQVTPRPRTSPRPSVS